MNEIIPTLELFAYSFALTFVIGVISFVIKRDEAYDAAGGLSFVITLHKSLAFSGQRLRRFWEIPLRNLINSFFVLVWLTRLMVFLYRRHNEHGSDNRLKPMREKPKSYLFFFVFQSLWPFYTAFPVLLINILLKFNASSNLLYYGEQTFPVNGWDYIGWTIFLIGFWMETEADYVRLSKIHAAKVKYEEKISRAERRGIELSTQDRIFAKPFCTESVWGWCRHPNYFGETLLWCGIFISCNNDLSGIQHLAVICPLTVFYVMCYIATYYAERSEEDVWAANKEWVEYKEKVPSFFPNPAKKNKPTVKPKYKNVNRKVQ